MDEIKTIPAKTKAKHYVSQTQLVNQKPQKTLEKFLDNDRSTLLAKKSLKPHKKSWKNKLSFLDNCETLLHKTSYNL